VEFHIESTANRIYLALSVYICTFSTVSAPAAATPVATCYILIPTSALHCSFWGRSHVRFHVRRTLTVTARWHFFDDRLSNQNLVLFDHIFPNTTLSYL